MRVRLVTTLALLVPLAAGFGAPAAAGEPPPDGCTTPTFVSFTDPDEVIAPGTYTQAGPPAVSVTFGSLASRVVSFEVTTPGWQIFLSDISYVYDDAEGGALGQSQTTSYDPGVTASSETIGGDFPPGNGLVSWQGAFFQLFDCGAPATTAAPTTAAPTTAAPTTAAPTTAAPTTAPPGTAAPTTAAPTSSIAGAPATPTTTPARTPVALPATGGKANVAIVGAIAVLGGLALVGATRRRTTS